MLMSNGEIVTEYRQAKDPAKQIDILADLNKTTKRAIVDILRANGCGVPGNYGSKKVETPEDNAKAPETPEAPKHSIEDSVKVLADVDRARQRLASEKLALEDTLALVFGALDDYLEAPAEAEVRSEGAFIGYLSAVRDTYEALRGPIRR